MPVIQSTLDTASEAFQRNRAHMQALVERVRSLEARARESSAKAKPLFDKRGQLLPRERIARLLDAGAPWLELSSLAGYLHDTQDPEATIPGGAMICGIGYVSGVRVMVVASDSGIDAGAFQVLGAEKMLRAQAIALESKLPFLHLVESAGANLLKYRVEFFIGGGALFYNLARLSAAGIPVITVVHGSSTAGGAYMPGLSDYVVMVRGRAKAFLAGPPLLKAATGEIATDEELGGAVMHTHVSGLGEYLAEDDSDAVRLAREVVGRLGWGAAPPPAGKPPRYPAEELLGVMPEDYRKPVDMREAIARFADDSDFLDFKPDYGPATVCGHAAVQGMPVGDRDQQRAARPGRVEQGHALHPDLLPGRAADPLPAEHHRLHRRQGFRGSRHDQARLEDDPGGVQCQRAADHAHVRRLVRCRELWHVRARLRPRFLFSWPNAQTAVMGAEQAALTMAIVMEAGMRRKGQEVDTAQIEDVKRAIATNFERQQSAFVTSGLMLDDGVIDPRDTRNVLGFALSICREADARRLRPVQFGVARP